MTRGAEDVARFLLRSSGLPAPARRAAPPLPSRITVEPIPACNLSCPLCPTGAGSTDLAKRPLSLRDFRKIVDPLPGLKQVFLYHWGEPFLNKEIFAIIAHARARGLETHIDSNLSFDRGDDFLRRIIDSGLSLLRVSLDGCSQRTYARYRVGGRFDWAFDNMRRLRELQKELKARSPRVLWKFIVNRHNEHEVARARALAKSIDVPVQFDPIILADDLPDQRLGGTVEQRAAAWLPRNARYVSSYYDAIPPRVPMRKGACPHPFQSAWIDSSGDVFPCCYASLQKHAFGNVLERPLREIWRSAPYRQARGFRARGEKPLDIICNRCPLYGPPRQGT